MMGGKELLIYSSFNIANWNASNSIEIEIEFQYQIMMIQWILNLKFLIFDSVMLKKSLKIWNFQSLHQNFMFSTSNLMCN